MHLSIVLLDASEVSRFALHYFLTHLDNNLIQVACANSRNELIQHLVSKDVNAVLVNYSSIEKSSILEFDKLLTLFPHLKGIIFNFSGSNHDLICMVKSGIKGVFDISSKLQDILIQIPLLKSQGQPTRSGTVKHHFNFALIRIFPLCFSGFGNRLAISKLYLRS